MKTVIIPNDITLMADEVNDVPMKKQDADGNPVPHVVTFVEWVINNLTRDKTFGENYDTLESRHRIKKVLMKNRDHSLSETRTARPGDSIKFEDQDHKLLMKVIDKPSDGWIPHTAEQCLDFMKAIKNASED